VGSVKQHMPKPGAAKTAAATARKDAAGKTPVVRHHEEG
jgi:hypothetical protein